MGNIGSLDDEFCDMGLVIGVVNNIEQKYGKKSADMISEYAVELYEEMENEPSTRAREFGDTVFRVAKKYNPDQALQIVYFSRELFKKSGREPVLNLLKLMSMCENNEDSERALKSICRNIGYWEDIPKTIQEIDGEISRRLER